MSSDSKNNQNESLEIAAKTYCYTGCEQAKTAAVEAGEALVCYYANLYSPGRLEEDLKQDGYEGLLKALKQYDPDREVKFSTYAAHCITGEIRHDLRNRGIFKVPEWMRTLQSKVISATEELAQQNGAMPTLQEIAQKVNIEEEGIVEVIQLGCISLEEIDLSKLRSLRYENFKLPLEDKVAMRMSIEKMDELQQKVIKLIYYEGLTQEETAKKLDINQRKVSRLLNRGLKEMRASMA
ncbi:MAG: sigma-70 family RNA polymerase sigma factor [Bacillota bacterium]